MKMTKEINDIGFSPSFSCYSSDSLTSSAAAKVSREFMHQHAADLQELSDVEEEDFEFSLEFAGEEFSFEELALSGRVLLPIFDTDLVTKDDVESEVKELDSINSSSLIIPLEKMLISDTGDAMSYSSEEAEQVEDISTGTFCVTWRSGAHAHIKKSKSTGSVSESGSRRWKVKDILRRSNSAGKETAFFLCPKRVEESNKKRAIKSAEAPKRDGKSKKGSSPSVHELFYVQKRAEQKGDKTRSYLPYRQAILGFQVQVNGNCNKKLPF
ncbi:hypothetical protein CTI12_AA484880 [Artemisia annua]|uniref:Uncharacterized protein n=1 Tax=Artemisia annua TaxID=35608 RepID=A0A2U1LJC3_ARTAN|nr:hypothetical protein CTI12_AA484880 [Artemisia annua]